uniref:Uncharacterized protein n=1 Tax=Panagrolaimus sp. PS1159 TaxID=55785 RepID=A0AC35F7J7_9BILA
MFTRVVKNASVATIKTVQQRNHMLNASTINMDQFKSNSQNVSQHENHTTTTTNSNVAAATNMGGETTDTFESWSKTYSSSSRDSTSIFEDNGDLKVSFKLFLCQF